MKMSWSQEGDMQFGVIRKNGNQLKYVRKESTHTPVNLPVIPLVVLNRRAKSLIHYEGESKIYPDHVNALRKSPCTS